MWRIATPSLTKILNCLIRGFAPAAVNLLSPEKLVLAQRLL